jgi:hypothetical protein
MSFMGAAATIGLEGAAASIGAGMMMGATISGGMNLIQGRPLFQGIGQGALLGGIGGGLFGAAGSAEGQFANGASQAEYDALSAVTNAPTAPIGMTQAGNAAATDVAAKSLGLGDTTLQSNLNTQVANTTSQPILDDTGRITNFRTSPETGAAYYSPPTNMAETYAPSVTNPVATNIVSPPPVNPVDITKTQDLNGVTEPYNVNAGMNPSGPSTPADVATTPKTEVAKATQAASPAVQKKAKEAGLTPLQWINANPYSSLGLGAAAAYGLSAMNQPNTLTATTGLSPTRFYNTGYQQGTANPLAGQRGQAPLVGQGYVNGAFSPTYSRPTVGVAGGGMITANMPQSSFQPVMPPNQMIGGSAPNENQFYPGANIARGGASQAPSATDVIGGYDQNINQYTGEPVRMADGGLASFKMYENSDKYATIKDQLMKLTPTQLQLTAEDSDDPIVMGMANEILDFKKGTGTGGFGTTKKSYAAGGIASLGEYAVGGTLLRGGGDGMSDSIPAVIKGDKPQRAALAQGEFVVPADVVSHLGNGSTEAGAQHLYKMMDRVRKARTGNPRQGRQINSAKFMPV